ILPKIREVLQDAGYTVKHSGDREGQLVFDDIWLMLNESEVVIVDFTQKRPNVYLEYGMALVLGKPVVALTQDLADLPSDTPHIKAIVYEDRMGGDESLRRLPQSIQDTISDLQSMSRRGSITV